jgi:PAS domain-containing protein
LSESHRESKSEDPNSAGLQAPLLPTYLSLVEIERGNSLAHAIVATVREPLIVLDRNLRVVTASRSFYEIFQKEPADTLGRPFLTAGK